MSPFQPKSDSNGPWWRPAMILFFEISGWIAGPVIIAIYLGQWLDQRCGTAPKLYFGCVAVAFIVSVIGMIKTAIRSMKEMETLDKNQKNLNQDQKNQNEQSK